MEKSLRHLVSINHISEDNNNVIPRFFKLWWASLVTQRLKRLPAMKKTWVRSLGRGRSPGKGNGNPLQYSCLENPMDGGAWWATVHRVAKNWTWLSNFTLSYDTNQFLEGTKKIWHRHHSLEHLTSDEPTPVFLPGESQGWGSLVGCRPWGHTVGHDWSDLAAAATSDEKILQVLTN